MLKQCVLEWSSKAFPHLKKISEFLFERGMHTAAVFQSRSAYSSLTRKKASFIFYIYITAAFIYIKDEWGLSDMIEGKKCALKENFGSWKASRLRFRIVCILHQKEKYLVQETNSGGLKLFLWDDSSSA